MKRRWLRFSVRTLLAAVTLVALVSGGFTIFVRPHIRAYEREQLALTELRQLQVAIDARTRSVGPLWLRWIRDGKFAQRVFDLGIHCPEFGMNNPTPDLAPADLDRLRSFPHLESLLIEHGPQMTDNELARLSALPELRRLGLMHTPVTRGGAHPLRKIKLDRLVLAAGKFTGDDAYWITDLEELTHLELVAPASDADLTPLTPLKSLRSLVIKSDHVTNAGLADVARIENLTVLEIDCPITDDGVAQLAPLVNLRRLVCRGDSQGSKVVDKLIMSVHAQYKDTPLVDAAEAMSKVMQVPIRFDDAVLTTAGISIGNIKLTIHKQGSDLQQTFRAMLAPHRMACIVEPGGLLITTEAEAARRRPGLTRLLKALPNLEAYVSW